MSPHRVHCPSPPDSPAETRGLFLISPGEQWPGGSTVRWQPREAGALVPSGSGQNHHHPKHWAPLQPRGCGGGHGPHQRGKIPLQARQRWQLPYPEHLWGFGSSEPLTSGGTQARVAASTGEGDQGSVTAPADKAAFGREDISICSADT